jgi:hypothetical protein
MVAVYFRTVLKRIETCGAIAVLNMILRIGKEVPKSKEKLLICCLKNALNGKLKTPLSRKRCISVCDWVDLQFFPLGIDGDMDGLMVGDTKR